MNQELESEPVRQGNSGASPSPTRSCFSRSDDLDDTIHHILNEVLRRAETAAVEGRLTFLITVGRLVLAATDVVILIAHTVISRRLTPSRVLAAHTVGLP